MKKLNCYDTPIDPRFNIRSVDYITKRSPGTGKDGSGGRPWRHWEPGPAPPIPDTSVADSVDAKGGLAGRKGNVLMRRVRYVVNGGQGYPPKQIDMSAAYSLMSRRTQPGPSNNNIVNTSDATVGFKSYLNAPRKKVVL